MNEWGILETAYQKALRMTAQQYERLLKEGARSNVDALMAHLEKNKSVVAALVTSLLKKILDPVQDVRRHRTDFEKGYSARSLDTRITTPFFKQYFPKYANKESAFLTLATREKIRWTMTEGQQIKVRNSDFKTAFLMILDDVEERRIPPEKYLNALFFRLIEQTKHETHFFDLAGSLEQTEGILNIPRIIEMLSRHFDSKYSSRLPVIAIFTIYQELLATVKRYDGKILQPLKAHTSSDRKGFGDIEIFDAANSPFEIVEVKHQIPINCFLIFDIVKKSRQTSIQRYYILTTSPSCYESQEEETFVNQLILQAKSELNLEIIANGILSSLKYYLRFIEDYHSFIKRYTHNLIEDAKVSTEISAAHVRQWTELLKEFGIIEK